MAYLSVVVNSAADLKAAIESFAQTNGWTLTSGVLSKNGCYVSIYVAAVNDLRIAGGKNGDFTGVNASYTKRIHVSTWPSSATVHLFGFNNPDTIWMTMNYDVVKFHHMGFGNMIKYGSWGGGQWNHGQHTMYAGSIDTKCFATLGLSSRASSSTGVQCGFFADGADGHSWDNGYLENTPTHLECDIRGRIWEPPYANGNGDDKYWTFRFLTPIHYKNPNVFNSQTLLSPFQIWLRASDGYLQCLGHVDHIRWVKLTNYNPGDVITLGSDQWKLFPWCVHDVSQPDGQSVFYGQQLPTTGVLGCAIKYDGP